MGERVGMHTVDKFGTRVFNAEQPGKSPRTHKRKPITYTPYQASAILTATRDLILLDTHQISRDSFVHFWGGVYSEARKNEDRFLYNLVVRVFDVAKNL